MAIEKASFGAGCFWGVEEEFRKLPGVISTAVGYQGGRTENPTYEDVCSDETGHAEVCLVEYDPATTSFEALLEAFWGMHDPTTRNRQGPDVGSQYRSVIFCFRPAQEAAARMSKVALEQSRRFARPIVTEILNAPEFYRAEEYHQRYFEKRGGGACHVPKR